MKSRRENKKSFNVLIDRVKVEALEDNLKQTQKTKTAWLEEKIDEELLKRK